MFGLSPDELGILALSLRSRLVSVALQPAARDPRRLRARALHVSRQDARRRDRPPAAGAAAGRRRLRAAGAVRQARAHRQRRSTSGSASSFAFRWTGAALASAIMGFPLMVRAIRLSIAGDRPAARSRGAHAGRLARVGVRVDHAAARAAGHHHRHAAVVRARPGRVRRDDHVRVQHSGRDADAAARDLHVHAGARRRRAGAAPVASSPSSCRSSRSSTSEWLTRRAARTQGDDRR